MEWLQRHLVRRMNQKFLQVKNIKIILNKMVDYNLIQKGKEEELKSTLKNLERAAKDGFLEGFLINTRRYMELRDDEKVFDKMDFEERKKYVPKIRKIFNYISSMNTDKYWFH